ncbi:MAG: methylenetetrahydrofolate reductase [NAD(P)H] [Fusobacteriaceae bacterium]
MKIKDMFEKKKPLISFEVFPPNMKFTLEDVYNTIDELAKFSPDFISVTYGAGGQTKGRTAEISSRIKNVNKIETLAHLTCLGSSKEEIHNILTDLKNNNIENILALRGDHPSNGEKLPDKDFLYANELVKFIREENNFSVAAAYYPEGHKDTNLLLDLFHLKNKVEAGADFLISQIFFDNTIFYKFREYCEQLKINVPLVAGIIPVTNASQIKRITSLCGCAIPTKFQKILDKYEDKPAALKEAGTAYAIEQIIDLIASDIDGIHLYTMNKVETAGEILQKINSILKD